MSPFTLAPPGGRYAAGYVAVALGAPDVELSFWYPVEPGERGLPAPYRTTASAPLRSRLLRALIRSGALHDAPAARGRHPLLLYFASWGGARDENTALAVLLARRGYCVAALDDIEHEAPLDFSSAEAIATTVARADAKVRRAAATAGRVLSTLLEHGRSHTAGPTSHISAICIGAFGFSFGGAVAAEFACGDARVRAAANLDGWMFGDAATAGVPKPYLVIGTGEPIGGSRAGPASLEAGFDVANESRIAAGQKRYGGYFVSIDGTDHLCFCDAAVLPSLRSRRRVPVSGRRVQRICATYLGAFFDHYVRGVPAPLFAHDIAAEPVDPTNAFDPAVRHQVWARPIGSPGPTMR